MKKDKLTIENPTETKTISGDVFLDALLKTLNTVFKKFQLIKKEGNIYILGYDKLTYDGEIPREGGDLDIVYPEKDIVIVDRNCVIPFTKNHMENRGGWKKEYNDIEWLKGHTVGCKIFSDIRHAT